MKFNKAFAWISTLTLLMSLMGFAATNPIAALAAPAPGRTHCDDNGVLFTEITDTSNLVF